MKVLQLVGPRADAPQGAASEDYLLAEISISTAGVDIVTEDFQLRDELLRYMIRTQQDGSIERMARVRFRDKDGEMCYGTASSPARWLDPDYLELLRDSFTYNRIELAGYRAVGMASRVIERADTPTTSS